MTQQTDITPSDRLYNEDLAPAKERRWGTYNLFAMWTADVHSIAGYTFAAGLLTLGLAGWQVFCAMLLGILIIYAGVTWMGYAGQKTGVPYAVFARVSFGVFGSNLPALIRAAIAIFWYGIQTWLASVALIVLTLKIAPGLTPMTKSSFLGLSLLGWIAFLLLWAIQLLLFRSGLETVRRFADWSGPAIWVVMLALTVSMVVKAAGHIHLSLGAKNLGFGTGLHQFFAAAALTVASFSTLMLNFCDFARFAPSRRAVRRGNFWGLPVNFTAFALASVLTTTSAVAVYGTAIFDPVQLVARIGNTWIVLLGAVTFAVATIGINVVANFVSPVYDLSNLAPRHINYTRGAIITAVLSAIILPWKMFDSPVAVNYLMGALAAFLGPLFGIIMADYQWFRKGQVNLNDLYRTDGEYSYRKGWNPKALAAFIPAAAISAVLALVPAFSQIAPFSWFIGAGLGAALYLAIARRKPAGSQVMPDVSQVQLESVDPPR